MRSRYNIRNRFVKEETKVLSEQDNIVQQNWDIQKLINSPSVNVISTRDDIIENRKIEKSKNRKT